MDIYKPLNETYLPLFETNEGKAIYEETLDTVRKQFPQYVREIEGTADGANVPFHKVKKLAWQIAGRREKERDI